MFCGALKSAIEHLNPSLHLYLCLSYSFPFRGASPANLRLLPFAKKHPQLLTGQQHMHTRAAAAPLCAWNKQSLESRESRVVQPDACRTGYLPHSKPAMRALALQNGRSPACLLCLPTSLCLPARARQPSMRQVSAPAHPAWGREGGRGQISALAPVPEAEEPPAKSTSKTIEVNLKVSLVCLGFLLFSFPLCYCVSCLLFLFFTGLASILLLQLKLCPATELHIGFA